MFTVSKMKSKKNSSGTRNLRSKVETGINRGSRKCPILQNTSEHEGAKVARKMLLKCRGVPTAADLSDAIGWLVPIPMTFSMVEEVASRIHGFSDVLAAAIERSAR